MEVVSESFNVRVPRNGQVRESEFRWVGSYPTRISSHIRSSISHQKAVAMRSSARRTITAVPFVLGLGLSLLGSSDSRSGETVFQPRHVAQLRSVASTVISPQRDRIAYILSVPRMPLKNEDGPAWSELHIVDRDGNSRPYITGSVSIGTPQWLSDGTALLYGAKRAEDKVNAIYSLPIDGGESTRIVTHPSGIPSFSVSPDDKSIAFLATDEMEKERKERREKGFDQEIYEEDGAATHVWIVPRNGSSPPRRLDLPGSASAVAWNPNGDEIAVVLAPTPTVDDSYMRKHVHLVDVDSGRVIQQIKNPGKLGQILFNPSGTHLALLSAADLNDTQEGRLMVVPVVGNGEPHDLMPDRQFHVSSFRWRDNDTLLWIADEGTGSRLGSVTLDGQQQTHLEAPSTILAGVSVSADGKIAAMMGQAPDHAPEVFLWEESSAATLKRLTVANPWLGEMKFARQETVRWKARDGLDLEGVLVYPLNYVEGRRYPMIMVVHGGPESHEPNGWMTTYARPGQLGAARGFVVFYPNYRGSTGRGVEFAKAGQADAAGKEFDDLIDGIDFLVGQGLVDKDHVGITGASYGGYASAWGATYYSDRFAASVMFVGISDNVSKVGTTDIPEEMYLVHHRKRLWEDWDYFRESSPIRHVQKNRTPTLILHGKQDPRVHPSQSLELFRHLKTLGQAPVRLVLYEGEGHGNRKAAARFDYCLRLMQWMEHYLQGPGGEAPPMEIDYASELPNDP